MALASNIMRPLVALTKERTKWGAASPMKAIKPVCATAVPVAKASTPTKAARIGPSGRPKLRAVASPRLKPSSTRANNQATKTQSDQTEAIKPKEVQPTKLVEPSMKACMACKESGENNNTICVKAPSTTPTTTPASNKRSVCCTPLANSKVNKTAKTAPPNAAPVKPSRTQTLLEKTLTATPLFIMLPKPNMPPPPSAASASATPNEAPEALPNKNGSAKGLRNKPCATAPASPSKAPAAQAPRVRGKRISKTICCAMAVADGSACGCNKGCSKFSKPVLPTPMPSNVKTKANTSSAANSHHTGCECP